MGVTIGTQDTNHSHGDSGHNHPIGVLLATASAGSSGTAGNPMAGTLGATSITGLSTIISNSSANLGNQNANHSHTPTLGNGDIETRPHNVGVNYIIKI